MLFLIMIFLSYLEKVQVLVVVEQINNVGAYDVHYHYENWIFVNSGRIKEGG